MDVRTSQFRVPHDAELSWRTFGDETVVYHGASGDTHLLNPIAAEALRMLASAPAGAEGLSRRLADRASADERADLPGHLARLLASLTDLGLIEPVDDDPRPDANPTG